jgi:hypothetical protein
VNRRVFAGVVAASLCFGLFTTYEHVIARGMAYFAEGADQYRNYVAMFDGTAGNPIQYRVLAAWLEALLVHLTAALSVPSHYAVSFIALRIAEDTAVFLLAFAYYRKLGLSVASCFIGQSLLAWGMSYGHHNTDLRFDSYLDVAFYLAAGWCLLSGRELWVLPLMVLAALNRETSGMIPVLLLAHFAARHRAAEGRLRLEPREWLAVAAAFAIYVAVFVALRLWFPPQRTILPEDTPLGLPLLAYNLTRRLTWVQLFAVLGIVPFAAWAGRKRWPDELRVFAWALVPVWFAVHVFVSVVAESRLFLVPQALVFVPGALFWVQGPTGMPERG